MESKEKVIVYFASGESGAERSDAIDGFNKNELLIIITMLWSQ